MTADVIKQILTDLTDHYRGYLNILEECAAAEEQIAITSRNIARIKFDCEEQAKQTAELTELLEWFKANAQDHNAALAELLARDADNDGDAWKTGDGGETDQ